MKYLLLVTLVIVLVALASGKASPTASKSSKSNKGGKGPVDNLKSIKLPPLSTIKIPTIDDISSGVHKFVTNTAMYAKRVPRSLFITGERSALTAVTTACVLVPVGILFNLKQYPQWNEVFSSGVRTGLEWTSFSTTFMAGETFLANMRETNDLYNQCFGSGLSGAIAAYKKGKVEMSKGFIVGAGFMYVIEKYLNTASQSASDAEMKNIRQLRRSPYIKPTPGDSKGSKKR